MAVFFKNRFILECGENLGLQVRVIFCLKVNRGAQFFTTCLSCAAVLTKTGRDDK
jgi:hypothetical protein